MSGFLQQTAQHLLQQYPDLKDISIILPSRRAAVFLKRELAGLIDKPVWSPEITTIEDFLLDSLDLEQADRPGLIFELYESYTEVAEEPREDFREFSRWAHLLLADFNEVDRYLVDARQLFSYLADAERIRKWDLKGGEISEMLRNYLRMWEMLPHLYENFYKKLLGKKQVYQGMAYREMARHWEDLLPAIREKHGKLIFIGFNALNTAEEKIMLGLYREGLAEFYWDIDKYYLDDQYQEAGSFLRKNKLVQTLREKDELRWQHNSLTGIPKKMRVVEVAGMQQQAMAANQEVLRMQRENDTGLEDVAVVMADEEMLPLFLNNLADEVTSLNITMGLPLKTTAAAGFFRLLLDMLQRQQQTGRKDKQGDPAFYFQQWDDLLGHPMYRLWAGDAAAVEKLRKMIRDENRVYLSATQLHEWNRNGIPSAVAEFFTEAHAAALPKLWKSMAELAEQLQPKFQQQDSLMQALFGFFQIFNRLADLMDSYPYVQDIGTATQFFKDLLQSESLDLVGEPLRGLQVMGMLETRCLDFRHLVLTSINEDILPKGRSQNSLIPFDIKREFGLPTYLEKDAVFAYHFYRLLQRSEKVTLLYSSISEGLSSGEPSRFITQLLYELGQHKNVEISRENPAVPLEASVQEESIEKTSGCMQRLEEMADRGISPSALINYINDPLLFYRRNVLKLQEAEDVEEVAGYHTQGNAVHKVLEDFYSLPGGDPENPKAKASLKPEDPVLSLTEDQIRQHLVSYLTETGKLKQLDSGKNLLIREMLTRMVHSFLKKEKELLIEEGELELVGLEKELYGSISLSDGREVKLKGIIDRIDRWQGVLRVIDYKTGYVDQSKLKADSLEKLRQPKDFNKSFQLMTYAWLYLKNHPDCEFVQPGIISLRNVNTWLMPLKNGKENRIGRELVEEFENFLRSLLEEIFNPRFAFRQNHSIFTNDED